MNGTTFRAKSKSFYASTSKRIHYWLEHHPIVSNSIICLNLWVLGDIVAQYSEHQLMRRHDNFVQKKEASVHIESSTNNLDGSSKISDGVPLSGVSSSLSSIFWKDHYDWVRTVQCASYGALVTGPILAVWYPYMDRICGRYKLAKYGPWAAPIAKVAFDEFLMDPPTLVLFFGYMNACEGGNFHTFINKIQTQFFPSWYTSLAVWPVVLLGTFRFLPVPVQAPVINVCCIAWDAFLSHRNALAKHAPVQTLKSDDQQPRENTPNMI